MANLHSSINEKKLLSLKPMIQGMYQAKVDNKYPLVTNQQALNGLLPTDLCQSYVNLWSNYYLDASKADVTKAQLNCRLLDLCCRAQMLNDQYIVYNSREPKNTLKMPFHSWILGLAPKETFVSGAPQLPHSSKKSILKSWPLIETNRDRVFSVVNNNGLGILACDDLVYFADFAGLTGAEFDELCATLAERKPSLSTAFESTSLLDSFETTANNGPNSTSGNGKTVQSTA